MKNIPYIKIAIFRTVIFLLVVISLSLLSVSAYAQDEDDPDLELPCGGEDPYADACPLDTWTVVLMVGGLSFGAYTLLHFDKSSQK